MAIVLDDFDTGFTSIHYLQSYGFSHIEIDKSLLVGPHSCSKTSRLVASTALLANGLDMRIIAQGVETEEQAALLHAAGCDKLQDFLFGYAVPIAEFEANYWAQRPQHHKRLGLRLTAQQRSPESALIPRYLPPAAIQARTFASSTVIGSAPVIRTCAWNRWASNLAPSFDLASAFSFRMVSWPIL